MAGISSVQQSVNATNVNFKGKKEERKTRKFENEAAKYSKPLKTHSGLALGGLGAVLSGLGTIVGRAFLSGNAKLKTAYTISMAVASAAWLLGGILIDKKINKNRAEFEEKRKEIGDDKLLAEQDKHVQFTKNGNVYYKTSVGKKGATILGAISALPAIITSGGFGLIGANLLGGFIDGAIIDGIANKKARKFADKKAEFEAKAQQMAQTQAADDAQPALDEEV